jgi:YHS domain-containing protein
MKSLSMSLAVVGLFAFSLIVSAEDVAKEVELTCPVAGKAAGSVTAEYRGGEIALCCNKCKAAFEKDPAKFAVKANHQLLVSGQAEQVKCPFTGGKLNPATAIKADGTEVAFCCNKCKGKASNAEGDALLTLLFSDAAFDKGFAMKEATEK